MTAPPPLAGVTVIQLTTGTPLEAEDFAAWVAARGERCLDGAILCGPPAIAADQGELVFSGDAAAWADVEPALRCLAGKVRFVGQGVGNAAVLDLAGLMTLYTQFLGVAHAANICRSQGVDLQAFIEIFPTGHGVRGLAQTILDDDCTRPTAALRVWAEALARIQAQARDVGISAAVPDFAAGYF